MPSIRLLIVVALLLTGCGSSQQTVPMFSRDIGKAMTEVELLVTFDKIPFHDPDSSEGLSDPSPRMSASYAREEQGLEICVSYPFFVSACVPNGTVLSFRSLYGERLAANRYRFRLPLRLGWYGPSSARLDYVLIDKEGNREKYAATFDLFVPLRTDPAETCPKHIVVPAYREGSELTITVKQRKGHCFHYDPDDPANQHLRKGS